MDIQPTNPIQNTGTVQQAPADSMQRLTNSSNSFIQKMTTPSNKFLAELRKSPIITNQQSSSMFAKTTHAQETAPVRKPGFLERIIPGTTIDVSPTKEMIADGIHPVAHEIKDRQRFNKSVRMVESTDDYNSIRKTNGAMGAYQVMPQWLSPLTKKYLGREVSKKEFMSSPQIQDQLFNEFMAIHVPEEGLRNATSRWFMGKPYWYTMGGNEKKEIMKDGNGLTAEDYWNKVSNHYKS